MNPFCPNGDKTMLRLTSRKDYYKCDTCGNKWKRGEVLMKKHEGDIPLTFLRFLFGEQK
jgi:hypothetical protein